MPPIYKQYTTHLNNKILRKDIVNIAQMNYNVWHSFLEGVTNAMILDCLIVVFLGIGPWIAMFAILLVVANHSNE